MTISSADRVLLTEEKRSTTLFVAQSNLQLLSQLQREGYSDDDLKKIAAAYDLALQLFTGYFRGNGKSFIAHLVGTASILASVHAPIEVVVAGLLHAAYIWGNFGTGQSGRDKAKCHRIRAVAGWEVESYITNYDAIEWNPQAIALLHQTLDQLHSRDRHVVLMRLANELEDHLDLGVLYCNNYQQRLNYLSNSRDGMIALAEDLGYPTLAAHLAQVLDACLSAQIIPELRASNDISYLVPPLSHQRRWRLLVKRAIARLRRMVGL